MDTHPHIHIWTTKLLITGGIIIMDHETFLWLIVPQVLDGFAQILVHRKFICAQAPRTMQGLLIGLWYAMFSIRYLLISSLDHVFTSSQDLLIYQAVRTGFVLLSMVLYCCMAQNNQYRVSWGLGGQRALDGRGCDGVRNESRSKIQKASGS